MGVGVFITKVMVVALQLLVAVAIVGSFGALAMGDFEVDVGEPEFDFPEEPDPQQILDEGLEISISVPISVTIGGLGDFDDRLSDYWPIDFEYSYSLKAAGWVHTGGVGPKEIKPGEAADLSLDDTILYKPGDDDLYDLVTQGTTFQFAMSINIGYMEGLFKFSTDVSATAEVGPFLEYGVDLENVAYDGTTLSLPTKFDYDPSDLEKAINDLFKELPDDFPFESVDDLIRELYEEDPDLFPEGFDIDDYDLSDLDLENAIADILAEQGIEEIDTFTAEFTNSEGEVIGEFPAVMKIVDGEIVFDIDVDPEFLEGLEEGDELKIYLDLGDTEVPDDLPGELEDIIESADGTLVLKASAKDIADVALGQLGG